MKTLIKNEVKYIVTNEQYLILSWLATIERTTKKSDKKHWQIWGLKTALNCSKNDLFALSYDISINHNFSGYQNMNRISDIQIFD